jgi:hypothetical protein
MKLLLLTLMLSLCCPSMAQVSTPGESSSSDHQRLRGEINLADLSATYGEAKVEINLPKAMIQMVSAFAKRDDPEVASLLATIDLVKVLVYDMKGKPERAVEAIDTLSALIRKDHWMPLVSVNDKDQRVRMMSRMTDTNMDGLVVMVIDNDSSEAVFINIVGQIDPEKVSKVTESLNIQLK